MSDEQDTIEGTETQIAQAPPNPQGAERHPADKRRFFDELQKPMRDLAELTGIHEDLLLTLAAHESGWWGAVAQPGTKNLSREKNNPFGFVKDGTKMRIASLEAALSMFRGGKWGEYLNGTQDIETFVKKLQDEPPPGWKRYNSEYPDPNTYKDQLRRMYKNVLTAKEEWKNQQRADE
jgi:hypothetical protein